MTPPPASLRFRAVSMEFAAYLDAHAVEMHIRTDTGQSIAIVCPRDSIFAIQKHIGQICNACPEIATWSEDDRSRPSKPAGPLRMLEPRSRITQHRSTT
jgi:hypothetical protein